MDRLDAYDFELPESLIAQRPVEPRDSSRLLVLHRDSGKFEHRRFSDLPDLLRAGDLLIANNSKVFRARLQGRRVLEGKQLGGDVEFFLLEEKEPGVWEGLFRSSAKKTPGFRFKIPGPSKRDEPIMGEIVRGFENGTILARLSHNPIELGYGSIPLPPYIDRNADKDDDDCYQTVYAKEEGSAAAPTAGLHFTKRTFSDLKTNGIDWDEVTLHVGLGTFRPVKVENVDDHEMHEERYAVSQDVAQRVNQAKAAGNRIVAVGTTSVRTLEAASRDGVLYPGEGRTDLFIRPGKYEFQMVDALLTNFHLPRSTLLMLICTFAGYDYGMAAYRAAVNEKYRFFSYGDAMLIL